MSSTDRNEGSRLSDKDIDEPSGPPSENTDSVASNVKRIAAVAVAIILSAVIWNADSLFTSDEAEKKEPPKRERVKMTDMRMDDPPQNIVEEVVDHVVQAVVPESAPPIDPAEHRRREFKRLALGGEIEITSKEKSRSSRSSDRRRRAVGNQYRTPAGYHPSGFAAPPPGGVFADGTNRVPVNPYEHPTDSIISDTERPNTIWDNQNRVMEGTELSATLYWPLDTTLGGIAKAILSEPLYAASGQRVLAWPGDPVLGRYDTRVVRGQRRVGIMWYRVTSRTENNDGIVEWNAKGIGSDKLGRPGIPGNRDTHFWDRWGDALMYTVIGVTASNIEAAQDDADNAQQAYIEGLTESSADVAQDTIKRQRVHDDTLTVPRATPIKIIISQDIRFHKGQIEGIR